MNHLMPQFIAKPMSAITEILFFCFLKIVALLLISSTISLQATSTWSVAVPSSSISKNSSPVLSSGDLYATLAIFSSVSPRTTYAESSSSLGTQSLSPLGTNPSSLASHRTASSSVVHISPTSSSTVANISTNLTSTNSASKYI